MNETELIDLYCQAWCEADPARRAALLDAVWAPGATYVDPGAQVSGAAALVEHITTVQARRPGSKVVRTSRVDRHHDVVRFAWRVFDGKALPEGLDLAFLTPDGSKIERVVGFFGPLKARDE